MQIDRTVHTRVPKATDIEIHTSTLVTESGTFVDIREYVVSLESYGRGITMPIDAAERVMAGVGQALQP